VQSPLGITRRLGRQATQLGSGGQRHRPFLAQKAVVYPPLRNVEQDRRDAPQNRPLLSTEAARTRRVRAFRLERRGLPTATPAWMSLSSRQLHEGAHLHPVLQQARQDAAVAATRDHGARSRRYALHLPTTTRKGWET